MKTRLVAWIAATCLSHPAAAQHVHSSAQAVSPPAVQSTAPAPQKRKAPFNHRKIMERAGYKKVSSLVDFPSFFPGIGVLYVKPETLPTGPFLAYDRRDRLVSTIYMIPMEDINNEKKFDLKAISEKGDHVTLYHNGGHPGVDMPHYHFVVWHVDKKGEARVAK
jgi:hypothetical protein